MNKSIFIAFVIASVANEIINAGVIDHEDLHPDQLSSPAASHSKLLTDSFGLLGDSASETEDASKATRQKRAELNLHYGIGGGGFGRGGGYRGENLRRRYEKYGNYGRGGPFGAYSGSFWCILC